MNHFEKACEELDASVFSSDMMFDPERYAVFREYLGRWTRAVAEHDKAEAIAEAEQQEHIIDCPRCGHCCPGTAEQALPVAWLTGCPECGMDGDCNCKPEQAQSVAQYSDIISDGGLDPRNQFDAPPPRQPWVGLTDDEIKLALSDMSALQMPFNKLIPAIARAIEAAHGIKGEA